MGMDSSIFAVRIPRDVKEKMGRLDIKWSDEIREFIEDRIQQQELQNTLRQIGKKSKARMAKIDSTQIIREDRDR